MSYVDGYIIPIKKKDIGAYKKMAKLGCKIWMEHGALDYYECVGDDIKNTWGVGFPKMCQIKSDETIMFSFIVYRSKAHRKQVNARVHKDPRMQMTDKEMPFDMDRFSVGGFKTVVQAKKPRR